MARVVSIGAQKFEELIEENCFYVDKTSFIREWWESKDKVTLITRPRWFGRTLNMSSPCWTVGFRKNGSRSMGLLFRGSGY